MSNHQRHGYASTFKAYPPQIDRIEMAGDYNAPATNVRAFLWEQLQALGERPYINGRGTLCCKLHNDTGTHAIQITQRGRSVWIRGSLSKWSGDTEDGRPVLPNGGAIQVVTDILNRLGLPSEWVKVHSIETGIDVWVEGTASDYTTHLRIARGMKRKQVQGERSTHYQSSTRHEFKAYDKGNEAGLLIPEGYALIRLEHTHKNGASAIGKALGLPLPIHASDLGDVETIHLLIQALLKMIQEVLPTGVPRATGEAKDVPLETAIQLMQEAYGDGWLDKYLETLEEQAQATTDRVKRKRIRDKANEIRERYSELDTANWDSLREAVTIITNNN